MLKSVLKSGTDHVIRLVILASIAFAVAAILSPRANAQREHFEPRGAAHFEPHGGPHFEPNMRFDDHFHHDHFYPALGFAIATLPLGYYTVHHFDGDYYFHAGVWYRHAGQNYVVVEPPYGAVVPLLPPDYTTVWVGAAPYYYANGSYYAEAPGGFAVVQPPASASLTPPPQAATAPAPAGNWYYCDSAKNYYPYVQQCAEGWRTVPATPPHPG
jgi:hypothetical protein